MYFPDEIFRNIASYNFDPYKQDRAKHASVWQKIRVKRERHIEHLNYTLGDIHLATQEDEYFVYTDDKPWESADASIPTTFVGFDNIHEHTTYRINDEWDYTNDEDNWYNYAWKQYGMTGNFLTGTDREWQIHNQPDKLDD